MEIRYKPFGEKVILMEWESVINEAILHDILSFKYKIENDNNYSFTDLIVGYNSLTIVFENEHENFDKEIQELKSIYKSEYKKEKKQNYLWEIPVCYDINFGIDLTEMAAKKNYSIAQIIQLHSNTIYTVFFIGFLPGFMYLGGLDERLFFDRKPNPRLQITKGSVAIGGKQTGVYPSNSAGGWNIIGRSPISFFNINDEKPCFTKAGDKIKFTPISLNEYHQIEKKVTENKYVLSKMVLDD